MVAVELIHRDSPKSPLYNRTEIPFQLLNNAFHRSLNRYNHFYPQASVSPNTPQSEITNIQGEYLVKYSIGTPSFEVMGIVDTGSDLIWSQCKPCEESYTQTAPMFDPSKSSTYQLIPCNSMMCKSFRRSFCNDASNCGYSMSYGAGSRTIGNLAFVTLTLGSTTGSTIAFPKISIGCGIINGGTFNSNGSGIVGLGGGTVSLISQLGSSIDFKFSYCLVPLSESQATSKLNFGENAIVAGSGVVSTPIILGHVDTFYYLTLEAMSVGATRINFVGGSKSNSSSKGNIMIDSGTTFTILPEEFCTKLESEVASQVTLERVTSPSAMLNLCFKCTFG